MRFIFLIVVGALIISSCQSENNPISPNLKEEEFPMAIGSIWEYNVTDTTYYYFFTDSMKTNDGILQVSIVGSTFLENRGKAIVWQYKFLNNLDSLYVLKSGDTTFFYSDKRNPTPTFSLIFPLEVKQRWQLSNCSEYEVLDKEILNLPFGLFRNAFNISGNNSCEVEASFMENYYIEPNVGIIKYKSYYQNFHYSIKRKIEWNLKSYSLAR